MHSKLKKATNPFAAAINAAQNPADLQGIISNLLDEKHRALNADKSTTSDLDSALQDALNKLETITKKREATDPSDTAFNQAKTIPCVAASPSNTVALNPSQMLPSQEKTAQPQGFVASMVHSIFNILARIATFIGTLALSIFSWNESAKPRVINTSNTTFLSSKEAAAQQTSREHSHSQSNYGRTKKSQSNRKESLHPLHPSNQLKLPAYAKHMDRQKQAGSLRILVNAQLGNTVPGGTHTRSNMRGGVTAIDRRFIRPVAGVVKKAALKR